MCADHAQEFAAVTKIPTKKAPQELMVRHLPGNSLRASTDVIQNQINSSLPIICINMQAYGHINQSFITKGIFGDKQTTQSLAFNTIAPPTPKQDSSMFMCI